MTVDRRLVQTEDDFIAEDLLQMRLAPNYNRWLFSLLQTHLGKRILEVGPGIGNMTRELVRAGDYVCGIEPNKACAAILQNSLGSHQNFKLINALIQAANIQQLKDMNFDTIVCVNVLEHIEHDVDTLRQFHQILPHAGRVALLVPAVKLAYGPIDASVGHFRRYSKAELREKLKEAGFQVDRIFFSNFIGLLGWVYNARLNRRTKQSDRQIKLFNRLSPLLSGIEKRVAPPVGLSLIALATKREA